MWQRDLGEFFFWVESLSSFLSNVFTLVAQGSPLSKAVERVSQVVDERGLSYEDVSFEGVFLYPNGLGFSFLWEKGLPFRLDFYLDKLPAGEYWRGWWGRACREVVGRVEFVSLMRRARDLVRFCGEVSVGELWMVRELVLRALKSDEDKERFLRARPEFTRVEWERLFTDERFVKAMKDGLRDLVGGGESEFWEYAKEERGKREIDLTSLYYPIVFVNEKVAKALSLFQSEAVSFLMAPFVLKIKQTGVLAKIDAGFSERLRRGLFFLLVLWFMRTGILDEKVRGYKDFSKALQRAILGMFSLRAKVGSLKEQILAETVNFLYSEGVDRVFERQYLYSDPVFMLISQDMLFCYSPFVKVSGVKKAVSCPNMLPVMLLRVIRSYFRQELKHGRTFISFDGELEERRLYHKVRDADEFYCDGLEDFCFQEEPEERSQEEDGLCSPITEKAQSLVFRLDLLIKTYLSLIVKDLSAMAPTLIQSLKSWFDIAKPVPQEVYYQLRKSSKGREILEGLKRKREHQDFSWFEADDVKKLLFSAIEKSLLTNLHTLIGRAYLLKKVVGYENLNPEEGPLLSPLEWLEYDLRCYKKALKQTINTLDKFVERQRARAITQKGDFTFIDHLSTLNDFIRKHALVPPPRAFVCTSKINTPEKLKKLLSHLKT